MEELESEFVPYQESLELKELGFDEICFAMFMKDSFKGRCWCKNSEFEDKVLFTSAPIYSQAFRFFREKYNLNVFIQNGTSSWMAFIGNTPSYIPFVDEVEGSNEFKGHNTYEEAELACLNKLIEIAKQTKPRITEVL